MEVRQLSITPRPTSTAIPVWNNNVRWYWVDPPTGLPVGPGGKIWSPSDTSMHMGAPGVNIGEHLPRGWTANRGGSADYSGPNPNYIGQPPTR